MRNKRAALLYYFSILVILLIGNYFILYFNPGTSLIKQKLENLKTSLDSSFVYWIKIGGEYSNKTKIETLLKETFSSKNEVGKKDFTIQFQNELDYNKKDIKDLFLTFNCEKRKAKATIHRIDNITFTLDCDNLERNILKEIRNLIYELTINIDEDNYELYTDKLISFNIFMIPINEGNISVLEQNRKEIASQIVKFSNQFGVLKSNLRINSKVLSVDEFDTLRELQINEKSEGLWRISAGNLVKLSEDKSLIGKNLLYSKESIEINIFSIVNTFENEKLLILKEKEIIDYFKSDLNYFFVSNHNENMTNQSLHKTKLKTLKTLDESFLISKINSIKGLSSLFETVFEKKETAVEFFKQKETILYHKKFSDIIRVFLSILNDENYSFSKDNIKELDDFSKKLESFLKSTSDFNNLVSISNSIKDLNSVDHLAVLDTFPSDYLIGVYLPLYLPIAYPIIKGIIEEIRNRKAFKNN